VKVAAAAAAVVVKVVVFAAVAVAIVGAVSSEMKPCPLLEPNALVVAQNWKKKKKKKKMEQHC